MDDPEDKSDEDSDLTDSSSQPGADGGGDALPSEGELSPEELWDDAVFFAVDARISGVYGMGWVGIQKALRGKYPEYSLDQVLKVIAEAKQQMELLSDSTTTEHRALMLERLERIFAQSSSNRWKLKALDQMAQILGLRKGDAPKVKREKTINISVLSMKELEMLAEVQKKVVAIEEVKTESESPFTPVTIDAKYTQAGGGEHGEEWEEEFEEDHFEGVDEEDEDEEE